MWQMWTMLEIGIYQYFPLQKFPTYCITSTHVNILHHMKYDLLDHLYYPSEIQKSEIIKTPQMSCFVSIIVLHTKAATLLEWQSPFTSIMQISDRW